MNDLLNELDADFKRKAKNREDRFTSSNDKQVSDSEYFRKKILASRRREVNHLRRTNLATMAVENALKESSDRNATRLLSRLGLK